MHGDLEGPSEADLQRIYNGFRADLLSDTNLCLLTFDFSLLPFDFSLLTDSHCKITTFFADVPTNYGKIHVRFEENALYARNSLIHREKISGSI